MLIPVLHVRAVVANIAHVVRALAIAVGLIAIGHQRTVVRQIEDVVVVGVVVAGVAEAVVVRVLLAAVGRARTVVGTAARIQAVERLVRVAVAVGVEAAGQAVARPADVALE